MKNNYFNSLPISLLSFVLIISFNLGSVTDSLCQDVCRDTTITRFDTIRKEGKKDRIVKVKTVHCIGKCPQLFTAGGAVGSWVCEMPAKGQKCACKRFELAVPACANANEGTLECKGTCPMLYKSVDDANNGRNPFIGKCDPVKCVCVYTQK